MVLEALYRGNAQKHAELRALFTTTSNRKPKSARTTTTRTTRSKTTRSTTTRKRGGANLQGGDPLGKGAMGVVSPIEDLPSILQRFSGYDLIFNLRCVFFTDTKRIVADVMISDISKFVAKYERKAVIKESFAFEEEERMRHKDNQNKQIRSYTDLEMVGLIEMIKNVKQSNADFLSMLRTHSPFIMDEVDPDLLPEEFAKQRPIAAILGMRVYGTTKGGDSSKKDHQEPTLLGSIALMRRMINDSKHFFDMYRMTAGMLLDLVRVVLEMLVYMKTAQAYHMDIKGENILYDIKCPNGMMSVDKSITVDDKCHPIFALSDFGLMKINPTKTSHQGTPGFMSPLLYSLKPNPYEADTEEIRRYYSHEARMVVPYETMLRSYDDERIKLLNYPDDVEIIKRAMEKNDLFAIGVLSANFSEGMDSASAAMLNHFSRRLIIGNGPDTIWTVEDALRALIDAARHIKLSDHYQNLMKTTIQIPSPRPQPSQAAAAAAAPEKNAALRMPVIPMAGQMKVMMTLQEQQEQQEQQLDVLQKRAPSSRKKSNAVAVAVNHGLQAKAMAS